MATRKEFIKTMAGGTAAFALPSYLRKITKAIPSGYRPNILWITMEDTCHQFIGCYGNQNARTPNMDRLASQGVRFTNAFSTAPVCAPSRSTIITGCLPEMMGTGHHRSNYPIPDFIKGFPYYLRRAGYFTSNNLKTDYNLGNERHFIHEAWDECYGHGAFGTSYGINTDTFDENSKEAGWWHRRPGQPFFSVFNLFNSHQSRTMTHPYEWYKEFVLEKLPEAKRISPDELEMPPFYRDTPEMRKAFSRVYNSLELTDMEFGGIINRLEKDGLKDDTIIFCFADHGEGIPKGKTSAIGLGYQVPFFIYFPPKLQHLSPWPIGQATDELVSSSEDTAPTVLSLAGVEIPKHMTGRPLLGKQRRAPRSFVFSARNRIDESPDLSRSVTDGRFFYTRVFMPQLPLVKFIKYMEVGDIMRNIRSDYEAGLLDQVQVALVKPRQPVEYLFDLKNDIWQDNNLTKNPDYQSQLKTMRMALQNHLLETRDILFMPEYEMARRSKYKTPYEFRMDNDIYPFKRVLEAANLVGKSDVVTYQLKLFKDHNVNVRYWAAVGLDAQGEAVKSYKREILAGLNDAHPSVRIVMAGIAFKLYGNIRAKEILAGFMNNPHEEYELAKLHALQTVEYMREKAKPFIPTLHKVSGKKPENHNYDSDVKSITDVTLHFLEGAPLYYEHDEKWVTKAHKEPDLNIHFVE